MSSAVVRMLSSRLVNSDKGTGRAGFSGSNGTLCQKTSACSLRSERPQRPCMKSCRLPNIALAFRRFFSMAPRVSLPSFSVTPRTCSIIAMRPRAALEVAQFDANHAEGVNVVRSRYQDRSGFPLFGRFFRWTRHGFKANSTIKTPALDRADDPVFVTRV
jgi:hypothetical protein